MTVTATGYSALVSKALVDMLAASTTFQAALAVSDAANAKKSIIEDDADLALLATDGSTVIDLAQTWAMVHVTNHRRVDRAYMVWGDEGEARIQLLLRAGGIAPWKASTAYTAGQQVRPAGGGASSPGWLYTCTVPGTSSATTEPTWPKTSTTTVVDGSTLTWRTDKHAGPDLLRQARNVQALIRDQMEALIGTSGCLAYAQFDCESPFLLNSPADTNTLGAVVATIPVIWRDIP